MFEKIRFLEYHYSRTKINYDVLYEMPIAELVILRNSITAFKKMLEEYRKHLHGLIEITVIHSDFKQMWLNDFMIPEVLDKINGVIGRRNMKKQQDRRKQK